MPNTNPSTVTNISAATLWQSLRDEANRAAASETALAGFFTASILAHQTLAQALASLLAQRLATESTPQPLLNEIFNEALQQDSRIIDAAIADLVAIQERDSACCNLLTPFLFFKGFLALQAWRISHYLWQHHRQPIALFLQNRISCEFSVDIHPAATIGSGVMMDHATGIVIGETASVGNNVSIMQSVTLGGTGKEHGDRHPKVGNGVLISAGAKILGNIKIGDGAKIGAGSVVLQNVATHTIVAGVPAVAIGKTHCDAPALEMDHRLSQN
jgi:serine O-acetyltransferase